MATTTNYGWTTPDDTSLVKDGAAAIRTLGSSVDTTTKALNPSTTLGDIQYRSATANTNIRVGIGSTGQVLTVAGGVPAWAAVGSPSFTTARNYVGTQQSTTSGPFTDLTTVQSVTLTTGTKVLIMISAKCESQNASDRPAISFAISGATTRAAQDDVASFASPNPSRDTAVYAQVFDALTAGSNTFTMKFSNNTGSGISYFSDRTISVLNLGS